MAQGRLSAFSKLNKRREEDEGLRPGPADSPGVGAKQPTLKGGVDPGKLLGGVAGKLAGPLANKAMDMLTSQSPSADRGASEDAYQQQRAGERQDFSSAMPQTMPNWAPWNIGGQPLAPAASFPNIDLTAPDTRFELPGTMGSGGVGGMQGASNVGTTGTEGGGFAGLGGIGGVAGGIGGLLSMLGSFGGPDNPVLSGLGRLGGGINTAMTLANAAQGPGAALGANPYIAGILGAANIGMTAAQSGMSDEDKAKQAAMQAVKMAGALAAPYTFGASMAVTQIMDFVNNMDQGMNADEALVKANDPTAIVDLEGGGLANRLYAPSKDWMTFVPDLYQNAGIQGDALNTLTKGLPYVQSKEELGQLLNSMKNFVSTTTGIPGSAFGGGYDNPYQLATIPGIGPVTHGQQTKSVDWRNAYDQIQPIIDQYKAILPGNEITAKYGEPGGSFGPGDVYGRLWDQFRQKDPTWGSLQHVPGITINDYPRIMNMSDESPSDMGPDMSQPQQGSFMGTYYGEDQPSSWSGAVKDFEYAYDPAKSGLTALRPGGPRPQTIEEAYQPSSYWSQLMGARPGAPGFTGLGAGPGGGQQGSNLQGAAGFAGLKGPAGEILGGDDSYRL